MCYIHTRPRPAVWASFCLPPARPARYLGTMIDPRTCRACQTLVEKGMGWISKQQFSHTAKCAFKGRTGMDPERIPLIQELYSRAEAGEFSSLWAEVRILPEARTLDFERPLQQQGRKAFICDVCNNTFANGTVLRKHIARKHSTQRFACAKCGSTLNSPADKREHESMCLKGADEGKVLRCKTCDMEMMGQHQWKQHKRLTKHRGFDICWPTAMDQLGEVLQGVDHLPTDKANVGYVVKVQRLGAQPSNHKRPRLALMPPCNSEAVSVSNPAGSTAVDGDEAAVR